MMQQSVIIKCLDPKEQTQTSTAGLKGYLQEILHRQTAGLVNRQLCSEVSLYKRKAGSFAGEEMGSFHQDMSVFRTILKADLWSEILIISYIKQRRDTGELEGEWVCRCFFYPEEVTVSRQEGKVKQSTALTQGKHRKHQ